jgi:uncharacterized Zn finger protein (UPF0148 family)
MPILKLSCPACRGPVFAPHDSDRELLSCASCSATLVTRRALDGAVDVERTGEWSTIQRALVRINAELDRTFAAHAQTIAAINRGMARRTT